MPTKEDLEEKYVKMETVDLLEIVSNKDNYTDMAVSVASDELKNRKISGEEIKNHESTFKYIPDEKTIENYFIDLNVLQKALCYFLINVFYKATIGRFSPFRSIYPATQLLRFQQANYYMVAGIIFFIIGIILSNTYNTSFVIVWLSGLVITFLFDIAYNKNRQINQIQEKIEQGINPVDFF